MRCPNHLLLQLDQGHRLRERSGYRGRFAPSPTGVLHFGNLQTALLSWLQARCCGGEWFLRIDDLDTPRNRPESLLRIQSDLLWLGLHWDGQPILQSSRLGIYNSWLSSLRRSGLVFACRCSRRDLAGESIYPGTCRAIDAGWGWRAQRLPSWRLRVPEHNPFGSGDVVVRRADGFIAYQLATVIDELSFGITDVVRGNDLRDALPSQLSIYEALGQKPSRFWHGPLLYDDEGQKLSKREASAGLDVARSKGEDPAHVIGQLAAGLGLVPLGTRLSIDELLSEVRDASTLPLNS